MNIEEYRDYCIGLPATSEGFPFDESTLVFKVANKMFALSNITTFDRINLKCDPENAIQLREQYSAVTPGFHMSKRHWNTIVLDGSISDQLIFDWIKDSYDLVVQSLPRKVRLEFELA